MEKCKVTLHIIEVISFQPFREGGRKEKEQEKKKKATQENEAVNTKVNARKRKVVRKTHRLLTI